nr:transposase [Tanacetum cinerariifolium]
MQPRYTHVSRSTLKRDAMRLWLAAKQEIIDSFDNLNACVNLTMDIWSAPHGVSGSYMCITAHWIEPGTWKMMKRVISFEEFSSPHTGHALFKMLIKVLTNFNLKDKFMSITLDNASNNTSAMDKLKLKYDPPMGGRIIWTLKSVKQDKCPLEIPLDFEEDVFDDEMQRNEAIPLSDEEIALDDNASSEGTLSPGGPRVWLISAPLKEEKEEEKDEDEDEDEDVYKDLLLHPEMFFDESIDVRLAKNVHAISGGVDENRDLDTRLVSILVETIVFFGLVSILVDGFNNDNGIRHAVKPSIIYNTCRVLLILFVNLKVTFSKRRTGFFKKASELCVLTGAQVAIFVKSLADRMYVSGQPHVDALIEKHLLEKNNDNVFSLPMLPENGLNKSCEEYLRDFEAENKLNEMITSSGSLIFTIPTIFYNLQRKQPPTTLMT